MKKQISRYAYIRNGRRVSVRPHTRTYHTKNYGASSFSSEEDLLRNKRRIRSVSPIDRGRVPLKITKKKGKEDELKFPKKTPIRVIRPTEEKDLKIFTAKELMESPPSTKEHAQKILALRKMSLYIPGGDNILKLEKPRQFVSIDTGKMQLSNEEKLKPWTKEKRKFRGQWARQVEQLERENKQKAWEDYQKEHGALMAAKDVSERLQRQLQLATSDVLRLPPKEQEKFTKEEQEQRRENISEWTTFLRKKMKKGSSRTEREEPPKPTREEKLAKKRKEGVSGMTGRDRSTLGKIRKRQPVGSKQDQFVDDFVKGKYKR